jgi:hypothetical protein
VNGLSCAGEIVDLDAPCGGYNLSWAFASGRLAAPSAAGGRPSGRKPGVIGWTAGGEGRTCGAL